MSRRFHRRNKRLTQLAHRTDLPCWSRDQRRRLQFEPLEDRRMLSVASSANTPADEAIHLFNTSTALFVENQGQWADEEVRYGFQGDGVNIAFTDEGLAFSLSQREAIVDAPEATAASGALREPFENPDKTITQTTQFTVQFDGANDATQVGLNRSESRFNYFVGDVANHRSNVAGYATVAYENLYDGIDLHTFGRRNSLKYEFYVAPESDYRQIEVSYDGIDGLWIDDAGALHVETELGPLVDDAPYIYQIVAGQEVEVAGQFSLVDADTYTFEITGTYDPNLELVVDPNLAWSSYLGGDSNDFARGIAVDGSGNILVTGYTSSSDWVSGGGDTSFNGKWDAFVVKLSSSCSLLWSSYLGGSELDEAYGIAMDGSDNVLVTGRTESLGWVSGGWDTSFGGVLDAFVMKLTSSGDHVWSSYLGGSASDRGYAIAVDESGNVLAVGETWSSDWGDTSFGGAVDGFVVRIEGADRPNLLGDFDSDQDVDADDLQIWQTGFGTASGANLAEGDADSDGDVDGRDLLVWQRTLRTATAATAASEPAIVRAQASESADLGAEPLSAELVDAAIAMDLTLRPKSGARLMPPALLRAEPIDGLSSRAKWSRQPTWRGLSEIAHDDFHNHTDRMNHGGFNREAFNRNTDDFPVNEELLDELFANSELDSLRSLRDPTALAAGFAPVGTRPTLARWAHVTNVDKGDTHTIEKDRGDTHTIEKG